MDILSKVRILTCKAVDTQIAPNIKSLSDEGMLLEDQERYRRLVVRLNCLTITCSDIVYSISVVCQFMPSPRKSH